MSDSNDAVAQGHAELTDADRKFLDELDRQRPMYEYMDARADRSLAMLIKMASNSNAEAETAGEGLTFPVTLLVGGTHVSGMLIGARRYYMLYVQQFRRLFGEYADAPELADTLDSIARTADRSEEDMAEIDRLYSTGADDAYGWVCLEEAQIFHGNVPVPTTGGALMRVRIRAIDGFILGRLGTGPAQA